MTDKLLNSELMIHRMREAIEAKNDGLVGEFLGASKQAVYNWKNRGSIPIEYCVKFCLKTGKSMDWLIFGDSLDVATVAPRCIDDEYSEIPLYDVEASAGNGSVFDHELIISRLKFRNDWLNSEGLIKENLAAIRIAGDSMNGTLQDDDIAVIDMSKRTPDGVFAIRFGDALRVKRLQRLTDGSLRVSSDNDMYREEIVHPENLGQVEIIGQCYWRAGRVF